MKRSGKKGNAWSAARKKLVAAFQEAEITSCEIRGPKCSGAMFLGFAHSLRRRNIEGDQLFEVALVCSACHQDLDARKESETAAMVREIIANRDVQPVIR